MNTKPPPANAQEPVPQWAYSIAQTLDSEFTLEFRAGGNYANREEVGRFLARWCKQPTPARTAHAGEWMVKCGQDIADFWFFGRGRSASETLWRNEPYVKALSEGAALLIAKHAPAPSAAGAVHPPGSFPPDEKFEPSITTNSSLPVQLATVEAERHDAQVAHGAALSRIRELEAQLTAALAGEKELAEALKNAVIKLRDASLQSQASSHVVMANEYREVAEQSAAALARYEARVKQEGAT